MVYRLLDSRITAAPTTITTMIIASTLGKKYCSTMLPVVDGGGVVVAGCSSLTVNEATACEGQ